MTDNQHSKASEENPRIALRQALKRALPLYSPQHMIDEAARMRPSWKRTTDTTLRAFINSEGEPKMGSENFEALAAFWLYTPLGRALRHPDPKNTPPFDQLSYKLATGQNTLPEGKTAHGLFFVCHGSYIEEDRYVVRVIEITHEDLILLVRDTVRDNITLSENDRDAYGAMVFVDGMPQIVLYGSENKLGFSLMVGTEPAYDRKGRLTRLAGGFVVMNKDRRAAYRRFYMFRNSELTRDEMLAQSGIFKREELRAPERKHHSEAFDKLVEPTRKVEPHFPDPMLAYVPDPEISPGHQPSA